MSYVYLPYDSFTGVATVGFYKPNGDWIAESDQPTDALAAKRVRWLNGGSDVEMIVERLKACERLAARANNTASCLANGIQPD